MNYFFLLREASDLCFQHGKEDSAAKLLLMSVTGLDSSTLIANSQSEVSLNHEAEFRRLLQLYVIEGIPVQHLIGEEYFYGRVFHVNQDVLIPRFETEELVNNVLMIYDELFEGQAIDVVDIGTGSGAIAITLDLEEENMSVTATDISQEALQIAQKNNDSLHANVTFLEGDMVEPLTKQYDILVSNPPYIPKEEYVEPLVKDHEPHIALFGGEDGLYFYRIILQNANRVLKEKSMIAFEHAYDKQVEIKDLALTYFPNAEIRQIKDMQGKDRMTFIINH